MLVNLQIWIATKYTHAHTHATQQYANIRKMRKYTQQYANYANICNNTLKKKFMKYDDIFALTAIKVLLSGLYRYGIAVTTIFVLLCCGFGPGKIQCTKSSDNILP